jgi:hypothetical protein
MGPIQQVFRSSATQLETVSRCVRQAKLATASFIIQCLSWQAGRPKELDQSFVRVASFVQNLGLSRDSSVDT